jgi:uncharacterized circularly permuted ATP-grasp superfamily protein/uncharacterized alpha-E superfamily protein
LNQTIPTRRDTAEPGGDHEGPLWPPASYVVPDGHYDEVRDDEGRLRAPWRAFVAHAGDLGDERLARLQQKAALRIRENGVTYNLLDESDETDESHARAWSVDALPYVMAGGEWEALARGLRQRARLLEALAADLYGEQRLVAEGLVPAALVYGHPDFARSVVGAPPPGGVRLHQLAFDVARGPDGVWRVIGTRAQGPSGAGYALENRITVSRLFPDAFRDLRVHMLGRFFRTVQARMREAAAALGRDASEGDGSPRTPGRPPRDAHVVLLTPGPWSETYFEHAYLARYLGFPLVEGGDLTVRDDRVWMQTMSGLEPVAAILRRLDDDFCDPVELRADSALGVAGLVSAWRAGAVVLANALGAGVLESPGLYGFLPPLGQRLLGETLEMASVATWWCGERAALDDAAAEPSRLVLKPAFSGTRMEPVFLGDLDEGEREARLSALGAGGAGFVLQERLPLSHVPVWSEGRLESRAMMLRFYLVADGRGDYRVMPGALARVAGADRQIVSGQRGGGSKDAWVMADGPVERYSMLGQGRAAVEFARGPRALASRAGENLFWFGRYAERAAHQARQLRAMIPRLLDSESFPEALFTPLVACAKRSGLLGDVADDYVPTVADAGAELFREVFAHDRTSGLAHDLARAAAAGATVRDWIFQDSWRLTSQLARSFSLPPPTTLADAILVVDHLVVTLAAVSGLEAEGMTRDDGWRVVTLGRLVERLSAATAAVAAVAASPHRDESALLEWLLDASDASVAYRARYRSLPEWSAVADLLVHDETNPRSVAWLLAELARNTRGLPSPGADLSGLVAELEACARRAADARRGDLFRPAGHIADFLGQALSLACALSDALALRYFRHVYERTRATAGI